MIGDFNAKSSNLTSNDTTIAEYAQLDYLSNCNGTRTHNHLVCKRTLNHLAKLAKGFSCVVSTYLYSAFDCMLPCHFTN